MVNKSRTLVPLRMIRCAGGLSQENKAVRHLKNQAMRDLALEHTQIEMCPEQQDSNCEKYKEAAAYLAHAAALIQNVESSNERLGWLIEECLQLVKRRAV